MFDHSQIVRDEQVRQLELFLQIAEQVDDLGLHTHVECADRFVANDEFRLHRQRPCDADALPLAAAELVRIPARVFRRQPNRFQQFRHPCLLVALVLAQFVDAQRFANDPADGHAWVERAVRVLENHLGLPAKSAEVGNLLPGKLNRPGRWLDESEQGPPESRLAAPAFADQADAFALVDCKRDAIHRPHPADRLLQNPGPDREMGFEVGDLEQVHKCLSW